MVLCLLVNTWDATVLNKLDLVSLDLWWSLLTREVLWPGLIAHFIYLRNLFFSAFLNLVFIVVFFLMAISIAFRCTWYDFYLSLLFIHILVNYNFLRLNCACLIIFFAVASITSVHRLQTSIFVLVTLLMRKNVVVYKTHREFIFGNSCGQKLADPSWKKFFF